jgi:S1-C subfamily serine protease
LYVRSVTLLDWLIVAFALTMAIWGYQQGLIVGALSLVGFVAGAIAGSRIGPALLPDGSTSPYAPIMGLFGALLVGGIAAVTLEGAGHSLRARLVRDEAAAIADGAGGALLLTALGLALAWMFGAVALNAPGAKELRQEVQRSVILRALNNALPPSGFILNTLNRIDPGVAIRGPAPGVAPPNSRISGDPDVDRAGNSVVHVLGTACGLGVSGSGWVAGPGLVVTAAHVVAGETDTTVSVRDSDTRLDATAVHYDPHNDLALLRVGGLHEPSLRLAPDPRAGTLGAVLGYPEDRPLSISPARLGSTGVVTTEDSYGRGPILRELTALRGTVLSGNSGGPMVDAKGRVLTTVFAATITGKAGGYGVPNDVVRDALPYRTGGVGTGPCTG